MKATKASIVDLISDALEVTKALDNHEKLRNSWFWSDNGNAQSRGYQEQRLNFTVEVEHGGDVYQYTSAVGISRKNFYYKGTFTKNGKRGDVRTFNKLLAALKQATKEG